MLTYEKWISSAPNSKNAPWLVLLAGVNCGAWFFENGQQILTKNVNVIAFNNPGVAESELRGIRTVRDIARQVVKTLQHENIETAHIFGHSMGGFVAQEIAQLSPKLVKNMVLTSTSMGQPYTARDLLTLAKVTGKTWQQFNRDVAKMPEIAMRSLFGKSYLLEKPTEYANFIQKRQTHFPNKAASSLHIAIGGSYSSLHRVGNIKARTLVISGDADALITPRSSKIMAEHLPNARYWELLDVGHFPSLEHPNFWQNIINFLQGETLGVTIEHTPPFTRSTQKIRKYWENLLWPTK